MYPQDLPIGCLLASAPALAENRNRNCYAELQPKKHKKSATKLKIILLEEIHIQRNVFSLHMMRFGSCLTQAFFSLGHIFIAIQHIFLIKL